MYDTGHSAMLTALLFYSQKIDKYTIPSLLGIRQWVYTFLLISVKTLSASSTGEEAESVLLAADVEEKPALPCCQSLLVHGFSPHSLAGF
ncbi:MAG TPA: hypothetical protein VGD98_26300 [Ktedonobacteraceae bacterium]